MRRRGETGSDGWILSEQLASKPQELKPDEIEPFLEGLFADIGRRAAKIRLLRTASVVRFLRRLAVDGVPSDVLDAGSAAVTKHWGKESLESRQTRTRLDEMALAIWNKLLQYGEISSSDPETALTFLKDHQRTYLVDFDVDEAIKLIATLRLPEDSEDPSPPPHLISQRTTSVGEGNPYVSTDLTEKIYIAYQVLKRHQIKSAQERLAKTLARLKVEHERGDSAWDYVQINDKVKQYNRRLHKDFARPADQATEQAVSQQTEYLVGLQIGVLNFNSNGLLPFFPIFNFGFSSASEQGEASDD